MQAEITNPSSIHTEIKYIFHLLELSSMIGPPTFTPTCLLLALMGEEVRVVLKMSHSSGVWRRIARAAVNG